VDTIKQMPVAYDPAKSERNEATRGLAFSLAEGFDWSTALLVEDERKDYGERRYQALGMILRTAVAPVPLPFSSTLARVCECLAHSPDE
jgi:uncharacterized DUF497 family protein